MDLTTFDFMRRFKGGIEYDYRPFDAMASENMTTQGEKVSDENEMGGVHGPNVRISKITLPENLCSLIGIHNLN
jgi:hypothetical protein